MGFLLRLYKLQSFQLRTIRQIVINKLDRIRITKDESSAESDCYLYTLIVCFTFKIWTFFIHHIRIYSSMKHNVLKK